MTDNPEVSPDIRSTSLFHVFSRQSTNTLKDDLSTISRGERILTTIKSTILSITVTFFSSIILSLLLSGTNLSITGLISTSVMKEIPLNLNMGYVEYYFLQKIIDASFYFIALSLIFPYIIKSIRVPAKFRELTESEARHARVIAFEGPPSTTVEPSSPRARSVENHDVIARSVEKHDVIAANLNTRVLSLQARATMIYWTILLTLGVGVLLVIFAGYLSSFDTVNSMLWSRLDNEANRTAEPMLIDQNSPAVVAQRQRYSDEIQRYSKHYDDLWKASIDDMATRNNQGRIWNWPSTILRVSVVGLLIFLVQILIQLYRYNSLLIVFYSSRRDAIIMSAGDLLAAQQWDAVFAPAHLDFGREPRHPFQAIASLLGRGRLSDDERGTGEVKPNGKPDKANASNRSRPPRKRNGSARPTSPDIATDKAPEGNQP